MMTNKTLSNDSSFRGIAHVLTGAGKTVLALAALEKLLDVFGKI